MVQNTRPKVMICLLLASMVGCFSTGYREMVRTSLSYNNMHSQTRADLRDRFGEPTHSRNAAEYYEIRGRAFSDERNGFVQIFPFTMYAGPGVILGIIGDILVFPYIFVEETYGAIFNSFCLKVTYNADDRVASNAKGKLQYTTLIRCSPPNETTVLGTPSTSAMSSQEDSADL